MSQRRGDDHAPTVRFPPDVTRQPGVRALPAGAWWPASLLRCPRPAGTFTRAASASRSCTAEADTRKLCASAMRRRYARRVATPIPVDARTYLERLVGQTIPT